MCTTKSSGDHHALHMDGLRCGMDSVLRSLAQIPTPSPYPTPASHPLTPPHTSLPPHTSSHCLLLHSNPGWESLGIEYLMSEWPEGMKLWQTQQVCLTLQLLQFRGFRTTCYKEHNFFIEPATSYQQRPFKDLQVSLNQVQVIASNKAIRLYITAKTMCTYAHRDIPVSLALPLLRSLALRMITLSFLSSGL